MPNCCLGYLLVDVVLVACLLLLVVVVVVVVDVDVVAAAADAVDLVSVHCYGHVCHPTKCTATIEALHYGLQPSM